ncbi:MAG: hypothetical protein ACYC7D_04715 [Nitrososphaerales archaeon]
MEIAQGKVYLEETHVSLLKQEDHFAICGTREHVAEKIRSIIDQEGASKVVLYPVFDTFNDLLGQLRGLSISIE